METLHENGVVLLSSPLREYDSRVEFLTTAAGRITVFCNGARRLNSPSAAAVMPFTFADYEVFQGRSAYTLKKAVIKKYFSELSADIDNMCIASYFSEAARYFTRENVPAKREVNLLYLAFTALVRGKIPRDLVRIIFELRLLLIEGIPPNVWNCVRCGKKKPGMAFYIEEGGFICDTCALSEKKTPDNSHIRPVYLSSDAIYTMQYILTAEPSRLFAFTEKEATIAELKRFMKAYMDFHVGHRFRSLEILGELD